MQFIYQKITDIILDKLKQSVVPWQKTWRTALPRNLITGLEYKGINLLLLGMQDYETSFWLTFKQCKELGGTVKKDEHSSLVVFWKPIVKITEKELDDTTADVHFLLRYYYVFNIAQCNLPDEVLKKRNLLPQNPKIIEAEQIVKGYKNPPDIRTNNMIPSPRYLPRLDRVEIQSLDAFHSSADYYASLFHELVHSTGATHRLSRRGIIDNIQYGSERYSKEELVAEIGASFLCSLAGITKTIDSQASYISGWLDALSNDSRMVVIAASQAQKATDYILGANSITNRTEGQ